MIDPTLEHGTCFFMASRGYRSLKHKGGCTYVKKNKMGIAELHCLEHETILELNVKINIEDLDHLKRVLNNVK